MIDIAIVGGTSFGHPPDFGNGLVELEKTFTVTTDAGDSPPVYQMRYKDRSFFYVQMHGSENSAPDEANDFYFVRTWAALYQLGVKFALGGATSGGIDPDSIDERYKGDCTKPVE
jgi:purine nucleoside phosphorylase